MNFKMNKLKILIKDNELKVRDFHHFEPLSTNQLLVDDYRFLFSKLLIVRLEPNLAEIEGEIIHIEKIRK